MTTLLLLLLMQSNLISAEAQTTLLQGYRYGLEKAPSGHEWESPEELSLNKQQPHSWIFSFESTEAARKVLPYESQLWQSLNGTWKFHWAPDPANRPERFYTETYDVSEWDDLTVPGCWNVQGIQKDGSLKYGVPVYCNQPVIFQHKVAVDDWRGGVMREPKEDWVTYKHRNEVGSYRRNFTIPTDWQDKEIYLNFDGVNSFFYLWINGQYVGFSKNSRTTASFDITRFLKPGENSVAVEVYRNSDGSFLEAQDMWRLPGIYRSVSLQAKPKTQINDLIVRTTDLHNGVVKVETKLFNGINRALNNLTLSYSIYQCKLWEDENWPVVGLQNVEKKINLLTADTEFQTSTDITIPNAQWWTSEAPNRYILVATLKDTSGKTLETVSTYFGIRKVEIRDTKAEEDEFGLAGRYYYVNEKPIKLKGVNRQEINLASGNTITHDQITAEVMLMRRGNINHVRTSHYSNDPFWFYTCDKYGIYLEDEANIESHEYYYGKASLSHVPEFRNAHVARVMEAAHAHVNSPCVVIWSLGNEAGPGDNFKAAYAALHDFDPSRPVQYERNNDIVDMGSNQYPGIDWIREAVQGRMTDIKYPFHVSEYAHSMGNAGGNLEDYWEAIESTNFFCGAAIWDWVDQALWNYTSDGTRYMAYGGDFGDKPNDKTFCMNGILFPDHTPKPEFEEVKKVYQYYSGQWTVDSGQRTVEVFNKHYFTPDAKVQMMWSLYKDGLQVSEPQLLADVKALPAPRERKKFVLPIDTTKLDTDAEYYVRLQFVQVNDVPWAKQGFVQAEEELLLQPANIRSIPNHANLFEGSFTYQENEKQIEIHGKDFAVTFDNATGTIARLSYNGQEYLSPGNGPLFNGYRAAVDNDNWWGPVSWIDNGLYNMEAKTQQRPTCKKLDSGILEISYDVRYQSPNADSLFILYAKQIWQIYPDGSIELQCGLHASDPDASLARFGYAMKLDKSLNQYAYYGRGPRNNYADRCSGSMHALYRSSVKEMFEPFPRPQDMANREDVSWCALTDTQGKGLQFILYPTDPAKKGCASVLPYSDLDLAYADHPYQLPVSDGTYLHLDAAVTGLGGNSCGQGGPLPEDCVSAQDRTFGFMIRPVAKSDNQTQPYTIYPIPQRLEAMEGQHLLTKTVTVVCDADIDAATRQRAKQVLEESGFFCKFAKKASPLTSNLQLKTDPSVAMEGKYDSYTLYIYEDGISITGQHTNAVFFGLASLEQMLEQTKREDASDEKRYLPFASITDYADLQNRGVVEGYYGFPYRAAVRQDLMRFMMRYKMNTYLYGGKSDPFHSQYWQQPYPKSITEEQEQNGWMSQGQMAEVARLSAESKVNFIWAIHPGDSIIDSPTVVDDIMDKFAMMHQLGIRQFALFVDDVFIPTEQADMELTAQRVTKLQQAIEQRWNQPYHNAKNAARAKVSAQDTVRPLHFVPQIYCSGFADSDDQRIRFMNAIGQIPTQITVYTTGQWVWTVPNNEHTAQVTSEFGRQMSWWWNYPCNDNADGFIYPMDMYSNFSDMPAVRSSALLPNELTDNAGLVANPMQQGMICKTPLFSVADYAWNNHSFDNKKSWEASFKAVLSDSIQQQAYRYLAEYLRPIDSDRHLTRSINDYRESVDCRDTMMLQERSTALRDYLNWILGQCEVLVQLQHSAIERERLLYADLSPWLHKLQAECSSALLLMDEVEALLAGKDDVPSHAARVAIDLDTNPQYSVLALEGMGEAITTSKRQATVSNRHLSPFVDYLIRQTLSLRKMH